MQKKSIVSDRARSSFPSVVVSLMFLAMGIQAFAEPLECSAERVRVSGVGDILVHQAPFRSVIGHKDGFFNLWAPISPAFLAADISYGNLEGPAAMGVTLSGQNKGDIGFTYDGVVYSGTNFLFNYHPRVIPDLQRAGFNILSVANNHTMDRRSLGLDKTIEAMKYYKMNYTGVVASTETDRRFWSLTKAKGLTIAWLSCATHLNGNSDSKSQVLMCNGQEILNQIQALRQSSAVQAIIVTPHWGEEYQHRPGTDQKNLARKFAEAGVAAIIGNHPHVLQSFEMIKTSDNRQVPVAYSLGNFVSGQGAVAKNTSAVLYLDFKKSEGNHWVIERVSALPTFRKPGPTYQVVPLANFGKFDEAWNIVRNTLKGVDLLSPSDIPKCR